MKSYLLAGILVVGMVVLALLLRSRDRSQAAPTPEAAVTTFFDAAGRGDDATYLGLVTGELRKSLEYNRSQVGKAAFCQGLKNSAAGMKGVGVTQAADTPPEGVALDVDLVFADRNEKQRMVLVPQGSGWVILSIETAQMQKPPVPYGTPVFEEAAPP